MQGRLACGDEEKNCVCFFQRRGGYLLGFRFREMVPDYVDDVAFDLPCFAVGRQTSRRKLPMLATADDWKFKTSFFGQVMERGIWLYYMSAIR